MSGRVAVVRACDGAALARDARLDSRRWLVPALIPGAVLACVATLALATLTSTGAPGSRPPAPLHGPRSTSASSLPGALAAAASASIGAAVRGYWPVRRDGSLLAAGGGIHSTFTGSEATLRVAEGTVSLSLAGVGRGGRLEPVAAVAPTGAANRVLYRHGSLGESYRNGPYGLEQGFTVPRSQAGPGMLVLALRVGGSLAPRQDGSRILFRTRSGVTALRYGQLDAVDATGRRLPARMRLGNGILQLLIDTRNARYPLRIDPFIQQGEKLTGSGEIGSTPYYGSEFGASVALSADGSTALIGGCYDNYGFGAVWVFTRSGETWTQQGQKLTGESGESGNPAFGFSVALSADGSTALIGGQEDDSYGDFAAAWVFTRSGSTWTQQSSLLPGIGERAVGYFGWSVALSSDGNTALIGGLESGKVGAAWVFTRSGSSWVQQGKQLTGGGESANGAFGAPVALSGDGNTAVIGSPVDSPGVGAARVFTRSGEAWTQQGEKLTGGGEVGNGGFGSSVALSSDGSTALIGGYPDNHGVGAAWVFARSGEAWTQQGEKLTGGGEVGNGGFGSSVALSSDGGTALIGGYPDNHGVGAAWVFARSGEAWTQQGEKLTGGGEVGNGGFGSSVALSSDGDTALMGGPADNSTVGAAWVLVNEERAPAVVTREASSVAQTSATLNATVNPAGLEVSECRLEYGSSISYTNSSRCLPSPGSGTSPVAVSAPLAGLSGGTTYHFRVVATNLLGTSYGSDETFTTPPVGPPPRVRRLSPKKGSVSGGTSVRITGADLTGATAVMFGSTDARSFRVNSARSITAVSPEGAPGTVDVTVTTPNGESAISVKDRFTLKAPRIRRSTRAAARVGRRWRPGAKRETPASR